MLLVGALEHGVTFVVRVKCTTAVRVQHCDSGSGCAAGLPPLVGDAARFKPVVADVEAIYATWLGWRVGAVKSVSTSFLLTVGFNSLCSGPPE